MMQQSARSSSESYFWPTIWAVALHALMFAMLFVSFQFAPELPPARPVVQATLYQLKSQSQATTQTNQKIAGEAKKTAARQYEQEQLEAKKEEQKKQEAAEQKKTEAAKQAAVAEKKAEAQKAEEAKKAEQKKLADIAKKKTEEEKKKAAEEAKKKAAEAAKKKAAEDAKKKAAAESAKKKAQEAARKSANEQKAAALAELLSDTTERQQALADEVGDQVAGSLDDLIIKLISENWQKPPSARAGMSVELLIQMLPDGTIINASITRSSGDAAFDGSAVAAVKNIARIPEMQQLDRATFDQLYRQRRVIFKPEDLGL
ncbi:cell envelope integrity protein TolA [Aquipseudomonas campi]|uniref:Cell envelope integrity protein TolA n=1 Tax=Aquipseudomonas campi TaxID=2731681 RepID=A0A6M8GA80_9GAMM|nr:cell envelope integrity protein TolA [Pseudomonas campi]QKE65725.1 cell envelope integrity protein TolA [Pseudomonas campi]